MRAFLVLCLVISLPTSVGSLTLRAIDTDQANMPLAWTMTLPPEKAPLETIEVVSFQRLAGQPRSEFSAVGSQNLKGLLNVTQSPELTFVRFDARADLDPLPPARPTGVSGALDDTTLKVPLPAPILALLSALGALFFCAGGTSRWRSSDRRSERGSKVLRRRFNPPTPC